jgi:hypothetical protein
MATAIADAVLMLPPCAQVNVDAHAATILTATNAAIWHCRCESNGNDAHIEDLQYCSTAPTCRKLEDPFSRMQPLVWGAYDIVWWGCRCSTVFTMLYCMEIVMRTTQKRSAVVRRRKIIARC